jgi:hypothetical protein
VRILFVLSLILWATGAFALPETLEETGFSEAEAIAFTPQYPLWSDGSDKRRWLSLPRGASIDKSNPDAWQFPPGTRAWKEFSRGGKRIETRFIERLPDGTWRYATYMWNAQGTTATLAPTQGVPGAGIPSRADCLACHEGAAVPILGFSAVQLNTKLPPALGYLHGNCGHCHNDSGPLANVELVLAQRASAPAHSEKKTWFSLLERRESILRKMKSRNPLTRMPPLGVTVPDVEGIALVERWLSQKEPSP